jgi:lipoprotein-releasing system permease protein
MSAEKWVIYLILAPVIVILLFSLVDSISMLIIEKKNDISILYILGANQQLIRKIFYREGFQITFAGLVIGRILGVSLALIQEYFGVIKLQGGFAIDAYPVIVKWTDTIIVAFSVLLIGVFSSWYRVRFLLKSNISQLKVT